MKKLSKRGLSAPIGMIFVLMIMIAVVIPMMYYINSMPSNEVQAEENAQPYMTQAQEQIQEVNGKDPTVGFYYDNITGETYVVFYSTPPIQLNITYFIGTSMGKSQTIDTSPMKTTFNNYPALEYQVGHFDELAMVTSLGNIIYAVPPPPPTTNKSVTVDPMWLYKLNQNYGSYTNPSILTVNTDPDALVRNYEYNLFYYGLGGYSDSDAIIIRENENGWINITAYIFSCQPRNDSATIGLVTPAKPLNSLIYQSPTVYYEQIEFYGNCVLFNASVPVHDNEIYNNEIGVITSYHVHVTSNHYEINFHLIGNQIWVYMYVQNGSTWTPITMPDITPVYDPIFIDYSNPANPFSTAYHYEGNYSTSIWGSTPLFLTVNETGAFPAPFGGILAQPVTRPAGDAQYLCGYMPEQYPYDPISLGAPIELIWGSQVIVQSVQTNV